ncbi:Acetylornithine deacetylase [Caulifigura coniformis]|uniref:Acetylornithine deacetylase n=1 Tax=Caulifigura coniformis TaxID=2527983 RepID=A0A517SG53_9PLAN|nr:M20 family metallopeptidase [Caulifigura coniformis]QDT55113.1 Acetylornithine deacetylase [Caulifigura coniformis]
MEALDYARDLISFDSISPVSNCAVTDYVEEKLKRLGFETERLEFNDAAGVRKASVVGKRGEGSGGMAWFGHTDVVPADSWSIQEHGAFQPTVKGTRLYGRGSTDMKGPVGCMLAAAELWTNTRHAEPLYITCTADEEVGFGGARQVAAESQLFREMAEGNSRGIIGEPTSLEVVHAHKGVTGFIATARGRAAHSSTDKGLNANLAMIPFLVEMKRIHDEVNANTAWQNAEFSPPSLSWNIGINDHTRAVNITAPQSVCTVYFRPMPGMDTGPLVERARSAAEMNGLEFRVTVSGSPVYTPANSPLIRDALALAERGTSSTVAYATDGAMFGAMKQLCVLGPGDIAQAHTNDEWIELDQLRLGTGLYARMIEKWCIQGTGAHG